MSPDFSTASGTPAHADAHFDTDIVDREIVDAELVDDASTQGDIPGAEIAIVSRTTGGLERAGQYSELVAVNRSPVAAASRNDFAFVAPTTGRDAGYLSPDATPLGRVFTAVAANAEVNLDMYATAGAAYLTATEEAPDINVEFNKTAPTTFRILCVPDADAGNRDNATLSAAVIGTVKVYRTQPDPEDTSVVPQIRLVFRDFNNSSNFLDVSVLHHLTPHIFELQGNDPVAVVIDSDSATFVNFVKKVRDGLAETWNAPNLFLPGEHLTPVDKPEQLWLNFAQEVAQRLPSELDVQAVFDDDHLGLSFVSAGETVTIHVVDETKVDADASARLIAHLDQLFATVPTMRFKNIRLKSFADALDDNNGRDPLAFLDSAGSTQRNAILPIELIGPEDQQIRVLNRVDLGIKHMQGGRGGNYAKLQVAVAWLCFHALINDDPELIDKIGRFVESIEVPRTNSPATDSAASSSGQRKIRPLKVTPIDETAKLQNTTRAITASYYLSAFWNGGSDAGTAAAVRAFGEQQPLGPVNGDDADNAVDASGFVEIPRMPLAAVGHGFEPFTIDRPTPEQYQMALDRAVIQASETGTATDASARFANAEQVPLTLGMLRRLIDPERGASLLTIGRSSDGMDHARRVLLARAITENPALTIADVAVLDAELIPVLEGRAQPYDQLLRINVDVNGANVAIIVPDTLELDTKRLVSLKTWLKTMADASPVFDKGWIKEVFLDHYLSEYHDQSRIAAQAAQGRILVDGTKFLMTRTDANDPIKFVDQMMLGGDDGVTAKNYDVNPMMGEALLGLGYATWSNLLLTTPAAEEIGRRLIKERINKKMNLIELWENPRLIGIEKRLEHRALVCGPLGLNAGRSIESCAAEMFRLAFGNALPNDSDGMQLALKLDFKAAFAIINSAK